MIGPEEIARLLPQKGAMCLLESVIALTPESISCGARSHLDPTNPLRRAGRLGIWCGGEYGMQAAALHGALQSGGALPPGRIAALRVSAIADARLDDPAIGALTVTAERKAQDSYGLLYAFRLTAEDGTDILSGTGTIALLIAAQTISIDGGIA